MAFSDDYNAVLCKCGQVGNVPGWHKILHAKMWAAYITIVNNYETVAKALILIIELLQSNPLKLNKIIVPTEPAFKELITVLTGADDVEIRYSEDIACGISSKKYRVIEDIIVIKNQEPKSLKYSHPDIIRLFDRFNISIRMIAKS